MSLRRFTGLALLGLTFLGGCAPRGQSAAALRLELALERLTRAALSGAPGSSLLIVGNTFAMLRDRAVSPAMRDAEVAAVRGIRKGADAMGSAVWIDYPELRQEALRDPRSVPIPAGATTPLSYLTSPGAWDTMFSRHPDRQVWLSLIGFPADLATSRAWTEAAGPKWVMYLPDLALLGPREAVRAAFARQKLLALLLPRPGAPGQSATPEADPDKDFAAHYVLVTQTNLHEVLEKWPQLIR